MPGTPKQEYARALIRHLLRRESQRELADRLSRHLAQGETRLAGVTLGDVSNDKKNPGMKVIDLLRAEYPEHAPGLDGRVPWVEPEAHFPPAPLLSTEDRGGTAVEYPDRYPNRVEAMRAFATVYRCSEEEVQRISQVAAVALHSETDPSVEVT